MDKKDQKRYEELANAIKHLGDASNSYDSSVRGNTNLRLAELSDHSVYYTGIYYGDGQRDILEISNGQVAKKIIDIRRVKSTASCIVDYYEDLLTDREISKLTEIIKKISKVEETKKEINSGKQKTLY